MEDIVYPGSEYARTNLTALPKSEVTSHTAESKRILEIAFSNRSLFQLILLKTALLILEEKFKLPQVCFQDPRFSQADVDFLEGRGHEVLPYSKPENGERFDVLSSNVEAGIKIHVFVCTLLELRSVGRSYWGRKTRAYSFLRPPPFARTWLSLCGDLPPFTYFPQNLIS
jgi:hypothetical protein